MWLLHTLHGRDGSWEAPCAHLVCGEGREGKSPRCFEQEHNSQSTWMPFGLRLFSWSWAGAGAVGAVSEAGGPTGGFVSDKGAEREGWRQEAAPGGSGSSRSHLGITTASLHSCTIPAPVPVPFHFGVPTVPPPDRYLSLNPEFVPPPRPLPPGSAPAAIPDPAHRPHGKRFPVLTVWLLGPVLLLALCLSYV